MIWHQSVLEDLDVILGDKSLFEAYRGKRVTLLGGSGFIGKWVLSSFIHSNEFENTNIDISVIATDAGKLKESYGERTKDFEFLDLDFSKLPIGYCLPESDFFLHAATSTNPRSHIDGLNSILQIAQNSTQAIIESARKYQNLPRVIHLSSGIVYPRDSNLVQGLPETRVVPEKVKQKSYRGAKLLIEELITESVSAGEMLAANPRLFAFSGPGLPIDEHFAVGNFLRDALCGVPLRITGNPHTRRSYMYPTDLVTWLLTILSDPEDIPTNVGSDVPVTLEELANVISGISSQSQVEIAGSVAPPDSYFPSVFTARERYGLQLKVGLEEGLVNWMRYLKKQI